MLSDTDPRPSLAPVEPPLAPSAAAEPAPVGILILTHGGLARELLEAGRVISGELEDFEALPLDWSEQIDGARGRVQAAIDRLDHGAGVLILTDMFGGTPSNVAMSFQEPGRVEAVSGVNLPMVVRLGCLKRRRMSVGEMAQWIRNKGRSSICTGEDVPAAARRPPGSSPCSSPCEEGGE